MKLPAGAADAPPAAAIGYQSLRPPGGDFPHSSGRYSFPNCLGRIAAILLRRPAKSPGARRVSRNITPLIGSAVISNPSTSRDRGTCNIRLLIRDALSDPYTEHVARRDLPHFGSEARR